MSQPAVIRTTIAPGPARSLSRVMTDWPSFTVTFLSVQPVGRDRRHGTSDADGTDWASNHSGSRRVQPRLAVYSGVLPASLSWVTLKPRFAPTNARSAEHTSE